MPAAKRAVKGAQSRPHDVSNPRLCQSPILDAIQYAAARAQLHDQMDILIVLKDALHTRTYNISAEGKFLRALVLSPASRTLPILAGRSFAGLLPQEYQLLQRGLVACMQSAATHEQLLPSCDVAHQLHV